MSDLMPVRISDIQFVAIDFESAGAVRGSTDVPVQIGVAVLDAHGEVDVSRCFASYLAADRPVLWSARKVHGISDEDIVGAPTLLDVWPEICKRMRGSWVVAHGAGTERRFLKAFPGHGFGPWVDTLQIYRKVFPGAESYSLSFLCRQMELEDECLRLLPEFRWHDALSDAIACLLLLKHWIASEKLEQQTADFLLNYK